MKKLQKTYGIKADPSKVWDALTNPALIRQYFFGTEAISDWKQGSTITYSGEWEGKPYEDKGVILKIEPEKLLVVNYWSSRSGKPDKPENYSPYEYRLAESKQGTSLTLVQEGKFESEESRAKAWQHWDVVINGLKELVEEE